MIVVHRLRRSSKVHKKYEQTRRRHFDLCGLSTWPYTRRDSPPLQITARSVARWKSLIVSFPLCLREWLPLSSVWMLAHTSTTELPVQQCTRSSIRYQIPADTSRCEHMVLLFPPTKSATAASTSKHVRTARSTKSLCKKRYSSSTLCVRCHIWGGEGGHIKLTICYIYEVCTWYASDMIRCMKRFDSNTLFSCWTWVELRQKRRQYSCSGFCGRTHVLRMRSMTVETWCCKVFFPNYF